MLCHAHASFVNYLTFNCNKWLHQNPCLAFLQDFQKSGATKNPCNASVSNFFTLLLLILSFSS